MEAPILLPSSELIKQKKNTIDLKKIYYNTYKTNNFSVDNEGCFISFTHYFKYLRSIIDFLLNNTTDIDIRISAANKVMGVMAFIWNTEEVLMETKYKLYMVIPISFAL